MRRILGINDRVDELMAYKPESWVRKSVITILKMHLYKPFIINCLVTHGNEQTWCWNRNRIKRGFRYFDCLGPNLRLRTQKIQYEVWSGDNIAE